MNKLYKLTDWYFGKNALPYWCVLVLDCAILISFYIVGYYCALGGTGVIDHFWEKIMILLPCMLPYLFFFKVFHTYSNVIRYSSFIDLRNVCFANMLGSSVILLIRGLLPEVNEALFPRLLVVAFAFCFSTLAMCGWRILIKTLFDISAVNSKTKDVFIYGTSSASISLAKSIRNSKPAKYIVRGFVTNDKNDVKHYVSGIPVYLNDLSLVGRMLHKDIRGLMVMPGDVTEFRNDERLVNSVTEAGIRIYMMPEVMKWDGKSNVTQNMLQKVEIEDLLPREEINVDMESIGSLLSGKCVLVTGAAGSIGSEMARQIAKLNPKELVLIDQAETPMHDVRRKLAKSFPDVKAYTIVTSITNKERMESLFRQYRPDYVFHAAAYKHVPMMEDNPSEAVQNNIYGTRVIADLAVKYGASKFVMISTDKAVNPTNVMGCSKRICEIYCQSLNAEIHKENSSVLQVDGKPAVTQFVTTRFGNVLGSNGSVIPIFREQIRNGGPVTVTHPDIIRFFMLIPEACKLVLQAGTFGKGGEIFVFDMGKPVRIADMARRMIALSKATNVEIKYTGLRDGEKLFEEVLSDAEKTVPTSHPKIRVALVREYPYSEALRNEERLYKASFEYDDMATVKIMKEIVPEYKSRHSKYEVLDA